MYLRLILAVLTLLTVSGCSCFDFAPFDDCEHFNPAPEHPSYAEYPIEEAPPEEPPAPVLSIHSDEITNIIQTVSTNFKYDKRDIRLEDARTYFNENGIHTIQLNYISQSIVDVCEARMLIIDLVDALMTRLNSNPYLIPEFPHFAFFPFNFEIYIVFESFFIRYIDPFYVKWICMEDGEIRYFAADLDDNNKNCWHVRRESYYTSRDIVTYERKAEKEYKDAHPSALYKVFGDKRFIPPDEQEK